MFASVYMNGDDYDEQGYPDATNPDTRRVYTRAGV